jgi:hydrogenase expression/formation protein HypC
MCVAYPGQVLEIADGMAVVDIDRRTRRASTLLVPETRVGDWVVVAAGTVLRVLDPDEAQETRALLDEAMKEPEGTAAVTAQQQER